MFWAKGKGIWAAWTSSACLFSSSAVVTELLLPRRPRVQPQWHGGSFHSCRRQGLCKKGPSISFLCHDERARSFFSNLQKLDADWHLKFCFTKGSTKVSPSSIFLSQNLWLLCVQSAQDRVLQPLLQELSQAVRFRHTDFNAQAGSPSCCCCWLWLETVESWTPWTWLQFAAPAHSFLLNVPRATKGVLQTMHVKLEHFRRRHCAFWKLSSKWHP